MSVKQNKISKERNAIIDYEKEIKKYKKLWKSIEISTVFGKNNDEWVLLAMYVFFTKNIYSKDICDKLLQTPHLCICKEIKNINYIDNLLTELKNGIVKIAELKVRVEGFNFDWGRSRKTQNLFEIETDWPTIWLRGHGKSVKDLINEKDIDTEMNRLGYGIIYEESEEMLGFHVGGAYLTHIYIIAPFYIRLEEGIFKDNKFSIKVLSHKSVLLEDIIVVSPEILKGKNLPMKLISEKDNINEMICEMETVSSNLDSVLVRVYYKDDPTQIDIERVFRIPEEIALHNPQLAVLSSFLNEKMLRKELGLDGRITLPQKGQKLGKEVSYEIVCINLLSCGGFSVLYFGKRSDIMGIDIVAFSPDSKDIIIISCVRSTALGEKIEKIKVPYNLLKETLDEYNIYPIICTPGLYKDIITKNKSGCADEGIGLITADEMDKIYDMSMKGASKEILNYIKNLIGKDINSINHS